MVEFGEEVEEFALVGSDVNGGEVGGSVGFEGGLKGIVRREEVSVDVFVYFGEL